MNWPYIYIFNNWSDNDAKIFPDRQGVPDQETIIAGSECQKHRLSKLADSHSSSITTWNCQAGQYRYRRCTCLLKLF
jgi:hypothetical protein